MNRFQSIGAHLWAVTGILVIILVSVFAYAVNARVFRQRDAAQILSVVGATQHLFLLSEDLLVEQGTIGTALTSPNPANPQTLDQIIALHDKSESAFAPLSDLRARETYPDQPQLKAIFEKKQRYDAMFPAVIAALRLPMTQRPQTLATDWQRTITEVFDLTERQAMDLSETIASTDAFIYQVIKVNNLAWNVRRTAGLDRRDIAWAIAADRPPTAAQLQRFSESTGGINAAWTVVLRAASQPSLPPELKTAIANAQNTYFIRFRPQREKIVNALAAGTFPIASPEFLTLAAPGLDQFAAISKTALNLVDAHAAARLDGANFDLLFSIGIMVLSVGLALFTIFYVKWQVIGPLKTITRSVSTINDYGSEYRLPFEGRNNEIGQFAHAIQMFRYSILEKQRLEAALLRAQVAQQVAETSNRIKSDFLANMSHELRTPLNAIIGFSDAILHKIYGPRSDKYEEYVGLIHESGQHLLALVSDILDLAKIEAGKLVLDMRPMDLKESVDYCIQLSRRAATGRNIALVAKLPPTPITIEADQRACRQILLNVVSNAIKFTPPGGEVRITAGLIEVFARIVVEDTGIGIPPDALARIGQAFEQASNDPMLAREGTGLGLALVCALVSQHGGTVRIESKEREGTTVTIQLPVRNAKAAGHDLAVSDTPRLERAKAIPA